jgi:predicted PurR-regulated permease PerM
MVAVSLLIAKYPGYLGLSAERVRSSLLMFAAAFVLYVALDLVSGRALTSMTDLPRAVSVLLIAVAALLIANVIYLLVRRRAPR